MSGMDYSSLVTDRSIWGLPTLRGLGGPLSAFDRQQLWWMICRIALIVFSLEFAIMLCLSGTQLIEASFIENVVDATSLTLLSAPLIYLWVAKPFIESAHEAERALASELAAKTGQAERLERALADLRLLLLQNDELRTRLQSASQQVAESNERILQRIGADLHDGPAQLLTFAMLKLNRLERAVERDGSTTESQDFISVRSAITDTLHEIRNISMGLSAPEIEKASLRETIKLAIASHEHHTGTYVQLDLEDLPSRALPATKICIYRFLQEALSNAYRHAGGQGQAVAARTFASDAGERLVVTVADAGPGFPSPLPAIPSLQNTGLGLLGMRSRIEALGGTLDVTSNKAEGGTTLTATLKLTFARNQDRCHDTEDQARRH